MLIEILIVLVVCGLILWATARFPLDGTIKTIIKVVVVVYVVLFLLGALVPQSGFHVTRFWR